MDFVFDVLLPPYLDWISLEKAESAYYLYQNWSKSGLPPKKTCVDRQTQNSWKCVDRQTQNSWTFGQTDPKILYMCGQTDTKILPTEKVETHQKKKERRKVGI